jgi:hypothetical protein
MKPGRHRQEKVFTPSIQEPPFWQGSKALQKNKILEQHQFNLKLIRRKILSQVMLREHSSNFYVWLLFIDFPLTPPFMKMNSVTPV